MSVAGDDSIPQQPVRLRPGPPSRRAATISREHKPDTNTEKKLVDLRADLGHGLKVGDSSATVLEGNVVLYHNGAVITCDSAVRYSENYIEFFKNVIVNKDSIYVYGDRADYNGNLNLAHIYAPIIKMVDGDATLYTYTFEFNTLDNIGRYAGGGTLTQGDNLFESKQGYYYGNYREVVGVHDVEIRNPEYRLRSDSVGYNLNTETALFYSRSYIWNDKDEILSADEGQYDRVAGIYTFTNDAYILTKEQEIWADTMVYAAASGDALLRRNIQIQDDEHKILAFGDHGQYWGQLENGLLTERPAILNYDPEQPDTLFISSDSMFLYTVNRFADQQTDSLTEGPELTLPGEKVLDEIPQDSIPHNDSLSVDPTRNDSLQRNENLWTDTKTILEDSIQSAGHDSINSVSDSLVSEPADEKALADSIRQAERDRERVLKQQQKEEEKLRKKTLRETAKARKDSIRQQKIDIKKRLRADSTAILADGNTDIDTTVAIHDSPWRTMRGDSLATYDLVRTDSISDRADSSLYQRPLTHADSVYRTAHAYYNVKIYRSDFQAVCDSLVAFSIDSTIHMYINPVLWNGENQIKSDVVDVYTVNQQLSKAIFTGGPPLMSSRVDSTDRFNQIRGKVIEVFFRNNELYHTLVNGNAESYYYLQDDSTREIQGFLLVESGNISFYFEQKELIDMVARNSPNYILFPLDKIPDDLPVLMPNFVWEADRKPTRAEVFDRRVRASQRAFYESLPQVSFPITERIDIDRTRLTEAGVWYDRNERISSLAEEFILSRPPADQPLTP